MRTAGLYTYYLGILEGRRSVSAMVTPSAKLIYAT
jgi:hypothetical protein